VFMSQAKVIYASYLLRLWFTQRANGCAWIASIQSTATGELHRFPDLDTLVQFLSLFSTPKVVPRETALSPDTGLLEL
jgi:hypothetical protein